jgi:hypothetical protein
MRAKLIHSHTEWLAGDYEAPPELAKKEHLTVWHLHRNSQTGLTAMKVDRGAGVWNESGHLLFYSKQAADLGWSNSSSDLYGAEIRFGPCRQGKGVRHALRRLESGTFRVSQEIELCIPTGAPEYLVINHSGNKCLATWLDQTQWGYVVVDLKTMSQLAGGLYYPAASLAPPDFSPDDAIVVSCSPFKNGWWTDAIDDYWDHSSPGGSRKVGTITVHNLASNSFSHHDLMVQLPAGWIPDRPVAGEWSVIWGPEFVSEREFKIWLPDDSIEMLRLPLPTPVQINRPLGTEREWLD